MRLPPAITRDFAETSDGQIHFRRLSAPHAGAWPLLLLHQVSSSSRMFDALMPHLGEAKLQPVAMDFPGFGASDPSMAGYGVPHLAEMTFRFLDAIGWRQPVLIAGHHTGAKVAVAMANLSPVRVSGLILAGIPYYADAETKRRRRLSKKVAPIVPAPDGAHLLAEWRRIRELSPTVSLATTHRELVDTLLADCYHQVYAETFPYDVGPLLPLLVCPTQVIAARADVLEVESQRQAASLIPTGRFTVVEDAGVFIMDEAPARVAAIIAGFAVSLQSDQPGSARLRD